MGKESVLQRLVRIVGEVVAPIAVCARAGQSLPSLGEDVWVVHDELPDVGPLAGLAAGMDRLAGVCDAVFVTSCDHMLLRGSVVRRMTEALGGDRAVVIRFEGRMNPLMGVYRLETRGVIEELVERGDHRAQSFAERCGARCMDAQDFADLDPQLESFWNVNDPETYARVGGRDGGTKGRRDIGTKGHRDEGMKG